MDQRVSKGTRSSPPGTSWPFADAPGWEAQSVSQSALSFSMTGMGKQGLDITTFSFASQVLGGTP